MKTTTFDQLHPGDRYRVAEDNGLNLEDVWEVLEPRMILTGYSNVRRERDSLYGYAAPNFRVIPIRPTVWQWLLKRLGK